MWRIYERDPRNEQNKFTDSGVHFGTFEEANSYLAQKYTEQPALEFEARFSWYVGC